MKTKIKILTMLLLCSFVFTIGCTEDDVALSEDYIGVNDNFSSFKWYTSGSRTTYNVSEKYINLNSYVAFYDISQNAIAHEWTIPASGKFLSKEFTESDSIYTDFILPTESLISNDNLINVLFTEAGIKEVKLVDTFKDSVTDAVRVQDYWQVEKIFTIDVFANTNPACKVYKFDYSVDPDNPTMVEVLNLTSAEMPSEEDQASWPTVSIEAGEELVYEDHSTEGRPTARKWFLDGGKPEVSGQEMATIKYNKLGDFTAYMQSSRSGGDTIPSYSSTKLIPLNIKVLPSTKPFEITGNATLENGVISFAVTGEAVEAINQKDFFTVHVTNEAAGFDQNIAIESVSINSSDATIINVALAEPTYNTDEIKISFSGGNIVSVDSRVLQDFDATTVKFSLGDNILSSSWSSFEDSSTNWKSGFLTGFWVGNSNDDNGSTVDPIFKQSDEQAFEGNFSARYKFDLSKNMTLQGSNFSKPNGVAEGTYKVSYMVYLEPGNTLKKFKSAIQSPFQLIEWDLESLPRGEWIEISQVVTTGAVPSGKRFDIKIDVGDNPGVSGEQIIYFDNISWIPLVPRT